MPPGSSRRVAVSIADPDDFEVAGGVIGYAVYILQDDASGEAKARGFLGEIGGRQTGRAGEGS